jgi:hypothetical protein
MKKRSRLLILSHFLRKTGAHLIHGGYRFQARRLRGAQAVEGSTVGDEKGPTFIRLSSQRRDVTT